MAGKIKSTGNFWAGTTVAAFPAAILVTQSLGFGAAIAFAWGIAASLAVLCANGMTEGRLWMFDPKWRERFDRPDLSFHLALVAGAILLIVESFVLVMLLTGGLER